MNDKRLQVELLSNKWDSVTVKRKGCPRKSWSVQMDSLKKEFDLQDKVLDVKLTKKNLEKRMCEEFEMALQHESKLCAYRELK